MSERAATVLKYAPTSVIRAGLLQRKCPCGNSTIVGGECGECRKQQLQRRLSIGATNDPLEQEADRIADQVLAAPENSAVGTVPPRIQRFTGRSSGQTDTVPACVDRVLASPGRPLDSSLQQDMEQRFGYDLSRVRIHANDRAAESARAVNALAYTVGRNIAFGAGQYTPDTAAGRRLLAHELTHVIQQSDGNNIGIQRQEPPKKAPVSTGATTGESGTTNANSASTATTVSADSVTITWGNDADQSVVKATSETVIKEIVANAGLTSCKITSTARTPEDQARAMYNNLETVGVEAQKSLYASAGDKVIDVYVASKAAKKSGAEIKADMVAKINELGPSSVSRHCADASVLCVVDIAPSSISDKPKFIAAFERDARVSYSLKPPADPAYHLEIPQ